MDGTAVSLQRGFLVQRRSGWKQRESGWWQTCTKKRMPWVVVTIGPAGSRYATVVYSTASMTCDEWDPSFTDSVLNTLGDEIRLLVHTRGSRQASAWHGSARGCLKSIEWDSAMHFGWWFTRMCGDPESWDRIKNPHSFDDNRPVSALYRDLVFDWVDDLAVEQTPDLVPALRGDDESVESFDESFWRVP